MNTREAGIQRLRELADELERDDSLCLAIQWVRTKAENPNIESMDFGHAIVTDALAMHALRVRIHHGATPAPQPIDKKDIQ